MSKKIDWLEIGEKLLTGFMAIVTLAALAIAVIGAILEISTDRTIIIRDDSGTAYVCTVSKATRTPHDCKPIKDMK